MFLSEVLSQFHIQNKTKQKKKKEKRKTLGKNPGESTFYSVRVCILKLLVGNFPRKCFRLVRRASQGICQLLK